MIQIRWVKKSRIITLENEDEIVEKGMILQYRHQFFEWEPISNTSKHVWSPWKDVKVEEET